MTAVGWFLALTALVVGGVLGWWFGRASGTRLWQTALNDLRTRVESGSAERSREDPPEVAALTGALADRWVPRGSERDAAYREALDGITRYLKEAVERPLDQASGGNAIQMKDGIAEAVGALEDLEFYTQGPPVGSEKVDLSALMREIAAEFTEDSGIEVRTRGVKNGIRGIANETALKDALFLILHNAGQFGGGEPIDVRLRVQDQLVRIEIRDRGPGFSADAMSRAYDPFFTTLPGGLGLGLTHARRVIETMGGKTHLRNAEKGGAEVEIGLPLA